MHDETHCGNKLLAIINIEYLMWRGRIGQVVRDLCCQIYGLLDGEIAAGPQPGSPVIFMSCLNNDESFMLLFSRWRQLLK